MEVWSNMGIVQCMKRKMSVRASTNAESIQKNWKKYLEIANQILYKVSAFQGYDYIFYAPNKRNTNISHTFSSSRCSGTQKNELLEGRCEPPWCVSFVLQIFVENAEIVGNPQKSTEIHRNTQKYKEINSRKLGNITHTLQYGKIDGMW